MTQPVSGSQVERCANAHRNDHGEVFCDREKDRKGSHQGLQGATLRIVQWVPAPASPAGGSQGVDIPDDLKSWYDAVVEHAKPETKASLHVDMEAAIELIERIGRAERALRDAETRQQQVMQAIDNVLEEYRQHGVQHDPQVRTGMARLWGAKRIADLVRAARPSQSPEEGQ